jgi:spore coat protein U-like protein
VNTANTIRTAVLIGAIALLVDATASAATVTATFGVSASVAASCSTPATNAVTFGAYSPLTGNASTASATLSVTCTYATPFTIALNAGSNSASLSERKMSNGTQTLGYNLYTTSGHTSVWGDGTAGSSTQSGSGATGATPSAVSFTVYGQIPASQNVPAASYTDTVTVTVTY